MDCNATIVRIHPIPWLTSDPCDDDEYNDIWRMCDTARRATIWGWPLTRWERTFGNYDNVYCYGFRLPRIFWENFFTKFLDWTFWIRTWKKMIVKPLEKLFVFFRYCFLDKRKGVMEVLENVWFVLCFRKACKAKTHV